MAYFDKDFTAFFNELEKNNNKEWFDENRKRYEKTIKEPFKAFVQKMIERMQEIDSSIMVQPKDCIFRINRDIRFSKDKTPYKTNVSAIISKGGKKDKTSPGIYFEMSPRDVRIYSGAHMLDKDQLHNIRQEIAYNMDEFNQLVTSKPFVETFGEIHGEKNKRLDKDLMESAEKQPLLFNKSFYYFKKFDPKTILDDNLDDILINTYKVALPLNAFWQRALDS